MPRIAYAARNFRGNSLAIIERANLICEEYEAQGYDLTLRQLYYQFVARDWLPNSQRSYKQLGSIVNDARLAGLIDWDHLVDRTRNLEELTTWGSPAAIVRGAARSYRIDKWEDQLNYVEVWVEKEALAAVVERAANAFQVPYFSCRGYVSQSEMWSAGQRLLDRIHEGKSVTVLHLGDHDPSGIDMTRDIRSRLELFVGSHLAGNEDYADVENDEGEPVSISRRALREFITIDRIALNMDQVETYGPPPNPTKLSDSRGEDYVMRYGYESWELDALDPATLNALISDNVRELLDVDAWNAKVEEERIQRDTLVALSDRYHEVAEFIANGDGSSSS